MDQFDLLIIEIIKDYNEGAGISEPFMDRIFWKKVNLNDAKKAQIESNDLFQKLKALTQKGIIERTAHGYIVTGTLK